MAFANTINRGIPGDKTNDTDESEIYIAFKDNAAIQRLIDNLIQLRDHK